MDSPVKSEIDDGAHSVTPRPTNGEADLYIDPALEKKLLFKLDVYIAPVMTLIFLTAYLDRANIGNAASSGMTADLNITSAQLGSMFVYRRCS